MGIWDDTEGNGAPPPGHQPLTLKKPPRGVEVILRWGTQDTFLRFPEVPVVGDIVRNADTTQAFKVKSRSWVAGIPILHIEIVP